MMWKEFVQNIKTDCRFHAPCNLSDLKLVEQVLGVPLPDELNELLLESNGIENGDNDSIIFSTKRLVETNLLMRGEEYSDLFMPFDHLLFFGEDCGGNLFGYSITKSGRVTDMIFCWDHEGDSRNAIKWKLESYIEWYLKDFGDE